MVLPLPVGPVSSTIPWGKLGELAKTGFLVRLHAELAQVQEKALPAQDAEAHRLPMLGGHDGDAQIVFLVAGLHRDAAVVRQALFGDVQAGHDLEPGDHRGVQVAHVRRHRHRLQDAVDPVAQPDGVGIGLEVDVRGSEPQRFLQDLVHERRDGGFQRGIGFLALDVKNDLLADIRAAAFLAQFLDGLGAQAEVLLDDGVDGAGRGQDDLEPFAQQQPQVALLHLPRRFAEGQREAVVSSMPSGSRR